MKRIAEKIVQLFVVYTVGLSIAIVFYFLKRFKVIKVLHQERFPKKPKGMILVANHPSLVEPFLLIGLFARHYLLHPLQMVPISTPDTNNYYKRRWFSLFRSFAIPVPRGESEGLTNALKQMVRVLGEGRNLILFPEGGRTSKADCFLHSKQTGAKIGTLRGGVALLIRRSNPLVVPVWVEGTDRVMPVSQKRLHRFPRLAFLRKVRICIGCPVTFDKKIDRAEATQRLASALLELADEVRVL